MSTWIDCDVRYAEHRERVARVGRDGWLWELPTSAPAGSPLERMGAFLAGAGRLLRGAPGVARLTSSGLGRLAALAHDSRDDLRSKEQELAAHGVRWASDPAADELLAHQIVTARRRRAGVPAVRSAPSAAPGR